jgi:hypothetical protein
VSKHLWLLRVCLTLACLRVGSGCLCDAITEPDPDAGFTARDATTVDDALKEIDPCPSILDAGDVACDPKSGHCICDPDGG